MIHKVAWRAAFAITVVVVVSVCIGETGLRVPTAPDVVLGPAGEQPIGEQGPMELGRDRRANRAAVPAEVDRILQRLADEGDESEQSGNLPPSDWSRFPRTRFDIAERIPATSSRNIVVRDLYRNKYLNPRDMRLDEAGQCVIAQIVDRYVPSVEQIRELGCLRRTDEMRGMADAGRIKPLEYSDSEEVQSSLRQSIANMRQHVPDGEVPLVVFFRASAYKSSVGLDYFIPYNGRVYGASRNDLVKSSVYAEALDFVVMDFGMCLLSAFGALGCIDSNEIDIMMRRIESKMQ